MMVRTYRLDDLHRREQEVTEGTLAALELPDEDGISVIVSMAVEGENEITEIAFSPSEAQQVARMMFEAVRAAKEMEVEAAAEKNSRGH